MAFLGQGTLVVNTQKDKTMSNIRAHPVVILYMKLRLRSLMTVSYCEDVEDIL